MASANARSVPRGEGVLFSAKAQYTKETHEFLKVLLEESKLSIQQKQNLQRAIDRGQPFPSLTAQKQNRAVSAKETKQKPVLYRRRTKSDIIRSGAYEPEPFIPHHPKVNLEEEKHRLQSLMAFGKVVPPSPKHKCRVLGEPKSRVSENDRVEELVAEVRERLSFLNEMAQMGEEAKYLPLMQQQIAAKMRDLKKLNLQKWKELDLLLQHVFPKAKRPNIILGGDI